MQKEIGDAIATVCSFRPLQINFQFLVHCPHLFLANGKSSIISIIPFNGIMEIMEQGRVTRVIRVTFCLGHPGQTRILRWITCINDVITGMENDKLIVLDGDDGDVSPQVAQKQIIDGY